MLDGQETAGIARIRRALEDPTEGEHAPGMRTMVARLLLEACVAAGDARTGLAAADRVLGLDDNVRTWESEARRRRGELLAALGDDGEAELRRALEVARRQGARLFELRAAASLLRRRLDGGDDRRAAPGPGVAGGGRRGPSRGTGHPRPARGAGPPRPELSGNAPRNARGTPRPRSWPPHERKEAAMIAVMGAAGNVGSKVADLLVGQGQPVRALEHRRRLDELGRRGAEIVAGDLADAGDLGVLLKDVEAALVVLPDVVTDPEFAATRSRMSRVIADALRRRACATWSR